MKTPEFQRRAPKKEISGKGGSVILQSGYAFDHSGVFLGLAPDKEKIDFRSPTLVEDLKKQAKILWKEKSMPQAEEDEDEPTKEETYESDPNKIEDPTPSIPVTYEEAPKKAKDPTPSIPLTYEAYREETKPEEEERREIYIGGAPPPPPMGMIQKKKKKEKVKSDASPVQSG